MYLLDGKSRLARPKVSVVQPRCWLVPQEHSGVVERQVVQVELFWSSVVCCKACLWSWHCWAGWCCKWSARSDVAQSLLALPSCHTCHKFRILIVNIFRNGFFFFTLLLLMTERNRACGLFTCPVGFACDSDLFLWWPLCLLYQSLQAACCVHGFLLTALNAFKQTLNVSALVLFC